MNTLLVRHGEYISQIGGDPERLTERGVLQLQQTAETLATDYGLTDQAIIISSIARRACMSSCIIAKRLGAEVVFSNKVSEEAYRGVKRSEFEDYTCNILADKGLDCRRIEDVVIVTHQPIIRSLVDHEIYPEVEHGGIYTVGGSDSI